MFSKITLFTLCCLVFGGCFFKNKQELSISFSKDSSGVIISGINEIDSYQLQQQLTIDSLKHLPGLVEIRDEQIDSLIVGEFFWLNNTLIFSPNTPFVKGSTYVITTVLNSSYGTAKDILIGNLGKQIKGHEEKLRR
jgi:hypothetical protein